MTNDAVQVSVRDAIHAGILLGIGQQRTLEVWRALGGQCRDIEFARLWREAWEDFKNYTAQMRLDDE